MNLRHFCIIFCLGAEFRRLFGGFFSDDFTGRSDSPAEQEVDFRGFNDDVSCHSTATTHSVRDWFFTPD